MREIRIKNFWLKLLALVLAVIVWFYIVDELKKSAQKQTEVYKKILPFKVSAKRVPIKATIIGQLTEGYRIRYRDLVVKPDSFVLVGPENMLRGIYYVVTKPIDISEYTKPVTKRVELEVIGSGIVLEEKFYITVTIPIEKIPSS